MAVRGIVDVQQLMGAALEQIVVDVAQRRVLLRDLELAGVVGLEDSLETLGLAGVGSRGLSAAADAAVGAGHDLDEVKLLLAAFNLLDQLVRVAEAVGYRNAELQLARRDGEGLDALETAHAAFSDGLERVGGGVVQHAADDGFGHAARDAEDDASTGVIAERAVRLGVGQVLQINAGGLDEAGQLVRGEHEVDQALAVLLELGALGLELLGGAGHDRNGVHVLVLELLADQGAHHLHGAAAGGDLGHQMRVGLFHMLDPAGAAGGEHRELRAGFDLLQELRALFHDRQVGAEVGVIHHVHAETAQRRDQLAGDRYVRGHAELLGQTHAHTRGKLHDHTLVGVVQHPPHLGDLTVDRQSAGGADRRALAAADAAGLDEHFAKARGHNGLFAALGEVDRADVLNFRAHAHAQSAEDALGRIAGDAGGGDVEPLVREGVLMEAGLDHIVAVGVLLQLAVAALLAGQALGPVAAHQQLQRGVAALEDLFGVRVHDKAVSRLHRAGRVQHALLVLYQAQTAAAVDRKVFAIAQRGDVDAVVTGDLKHVALVGLLFPLAYEDFFIRRISTRNI